VASADRIRATLAGVLIVAGCCRVAAAQPTTGSTAATARGRALYVTHCAVCHGGGGQGDGPFAIRLKEPPPDLTLFAAHNADVFPSALVRRIIDGKQKMPGHGGPDMPIWGDAFRRSGTGPGDSPDERIYALVRYLETIQQRGGN
jgi:mono/diheme cytochrome c family protein